MPTVAAVAAFLDRFAPTTLAADWDNVGLLLGDGGREVRKLMTCLTVTPASAAEAVESGADLIVSHHPILFRPTQKLTTATAEGRFLWALAREGIAVYSPHTSFDNARGGINDILCRRLGLTEVAPLRPRPGAPQYKVVVFVPDADLERVLAAMFAAGAGRIGEYAECSYRLHGTGTFFGLDAANPTVGQKGRREEVSEHRVEVICPRASLTGVLAAMRQAHSYEEPAFDVYPLEPVPAGEGEGRVANLPEAVPLDDFARRVQSALGAAAVQVVGRPDRQVRRVAVACGAAGEFLRDAVKAKVDVFLTGEMRFHDYLTAEASDVALVLPGHYATERPAVEELAELLGRQWPGVRAWASAKEADPARWVS